MGRGRSFCSGVARHSDPGARPGRGGAGRGVREEWSEAAGAPDQPGDQYSALPAVGDHRVLVVRGTASLGWDDMQTAWYALLTAATDRVTLQTAYFAPDTSFLGLVVDAAGRGVHVQLLLPGPHYDKTVSRLGSERYYLALLDAGVEVWRYQPTMLHTKIVTIDGEVAMIGSSNFNRRSLDHDEEVACILLGGDASARLVRDFDDDLHRSQRVDPDDWRSRSFGQRLAEQTTRPLSRYL